MKANREIRAEAWRLLWRGGGIVRLAGAGLVLGIVLFGVTAALAYAFRVLDIPTLQDFMAAQQQAASQGLGYTASSDGALMRMVGASLFQSFIQYLLMGISTYGVVNLCLKTVRGERGIGAAFVGFGAPFSTFWLMFGVQIRTAFWMMLALMPASMLLAVGNDNALASVGIGLVMIVVLLLVLTWVIYRYRNVWLLKADHPEWGAGRCIAGSVEMMKGWKMRAVRLDCSYWLSFLGLVPFAAAGFWAAAKYRLEGLDGFAASDFLIVGLVGVSAIVYFLVVGWYLMLGHAIFYREQLLERTSGGVGEAEKQQEA